MKQTIASFIILYILDFLLLPVLFPVYFPRSNESFAMYAITLITASLASLLLGGGKLWHFILADVIFFLLIFIYPARGAYGFGMTGINLDGSSAYFDRAALPFSMLIMVPLTFLAEMVVKGIFALLTLRKAR